MTRRAFRPRISDDAGRAPARPAAAALPRGPFGSITVLIFGCLSRARGGREALKICCQKKAGAHVAPSTTRELFRVLRLAFAEDEKVPRRGGQKRAPNRRGSPRPKRSAVYI